LFCFLFLKQVDGMFTRMNDVLGRITLFCVCANFFLMGHLKNRPRMAYHSWSSYLSPLCISY
jgi:hypothetical protein